MKKHGLSRSYLLYAIAVLIGMIACGEEDTYKKTRLGINLRPAATCNDAWVMIQGRIVDSIETIVDENMRHMIVQKSTDCAIPDEMDEVDAGAGDSDIDADGDSDSGGAEETSETNNQVKEVDEADFVKNDNSHIYILADGRFQIIDAWPADQAHGISSYPIEGEPKKMFVHRDRAVVYSSLGPIQASGSGSGWDGWTNRECTYGYDCDFLGDGKSLKITVLDISDRTRPTLLREIFLEGSYLNSRRIENVIHTVAVFPEIEAAMVGIKYWPDQLEGYKWSCKEEIPFTTAQIMGFFSVLNEQNETIVKNTDMSAFIPSIRDVRYTDGQETVNDSVLGACPNFYISPVGDGANLVSLASFDITGQDELYTTTVVGRPGAVYASRDSLYIASRHYRQPLDAWYFDESLGIEDATTIHKFALTPGGTGTGYMGSGVVKGRILNQFSMDEHKGFIRVATTTGRLPDTEVHNTVSILGQNADGLALVGQIDNIAPKEDIRSARFSGDTGFVVTFKKTDPLYVLDLANPTNPAIKGELKIPGFSTYIHLMDETHLLTLGYDADDQDSFAWFTGIRLQIIDVADPQNPTLLHKEVIGTRGSASEAVLNHLAFNYFAPKSLMAIPMVICESQDGDIWSDLMTFSGLLVYNTTVENGFEPLGGIPHEEPETQEDYWGACQGWWTDQTSKVKRSVFMDEFVYSIAMDKINISLLDDLENPVAQVGLIQ